MTRIMRRISENYIKSKIPKGFNLDAARSIQKRLAGLIEERELMERRLVAGIDAAYVGDVAISAAVVIDSINKSIIDSSIAKTKVWFPYVPTLLSFRELKPMIAAYEGLHVKPHVIMIDGHGFAHPSRLGIASHFGVTMQLPTIGVAKSLLYGECEIDDTYSPILDPIDHSVIGAMLRCSRNSKPMFISIGNLVTLRDAVDLSRSLCVGSSMPLPILLAHRLANKSKRS